MNFSQSTFSAILASVIAAGIIALAAYLWKNRIALRNAFKKKETLRKETVEIEQVHQERAAVEITRRHIAFDSEFGSDQKGLHGKI